jgi:hypothetical protein
MNEYVYVVTNVEMGWDCVCGVYQSEESAYRHCFHDNDDGLTLEEIIEKVDDGDTSYVISAQRLKP